MKWFAALVLPLALLALVVACEEEEQEAATATPSPAATVTATPEATPTPEPTLEPTVEPSEAEIRDTWVTECTEGEPEWTAFCECGWDLVLEKHGYEAVLEVVEADDPDGWMQLMTTVMTSDRCEAYIPEP